jgi:hypothetical protein
MKEPFHTYQWIEAEVQRNSDFRPESFQIRQDSIVLGEKLDPTDGWLKRSESILRPGNVFASVEALQSAEAVDHTSLGLVKPKRIDRVYVKRLPASARAEWEEARENALRQRDLLVDAEAKTKDLQFMPVQYRVAFVCDGAACKGHDMSILDWGVYALSRKQFALKGGPAAEKDVIDVIVKRTDLLKHDTYFFLGNTKAHSRNFMVVGLYYPPLAKEKAKPKVKPGQILMPGFD